MADPELRPQQCRLPPPPWLVVLDTMPPPPPPGALRRCVSLTTAATVAATPRNPTPDRPLPSPHERVAGGGRSLPCSPSDAAWRPVAGGSGPPPSTVIYIPGGGGVLDPVRAGGGCALAARSGPRGGGGRGPKGASGPRPGVRCPPRSGWGGPVSVEDTQWKWPTAASPAVGTPWTLQCLQLTESERTWRL